MLLQRVTTLSGRSVIPHSDSLHRALDRIGDRWSLLIIDALQESPLRFSDLSERVSGIATNTLSGRLAKLEEEGVVTSVPYSDRPLRHRYELTAAGRELAGALRLIAHWGDRHSDEAETIRHDLCGTPLEPRWHCPSCDRLLEGNQVGEPDIHRV